MKAFQSFDASHGAFIHDIAYDFYGKRLATCSSDKKIKVWNQNSKGEWKVRDTIPAHTGSIHKLSWAHPEFGQILASCSADGDVNIYEEQIDSKHERHFRKLGRLVDSRVAVKDVQFAPRHLGLQLATCSLDGKVRIYESSNLMNLGEWPLTKEFSVDAACNTLCWNPSPFDPTMLVVGAGNSVHIWQYSEQFRRWQPTYQLGSPDSKDRHTDVIHNVDWAPQMGRSYHLIATACKDGKVRIFKVFPDRPPERAVECVASLPDHHTEVWRVSWNVTGTILASTGDDGTARLWKRDFSGKYKCTLSAKNSIATEEPTESKSFSLAS